MVKMGLDTTAFQRGLAKSQKSIGNFVKNGIRQFGVLAGAAGLGAMASAAVRLGAEISNLSKLANTGEEEFQRMAFAAKTLGIENEKVADILKDVSDKVGDFLQTGGGPMADFFENIAPKVGVTADMFRDLSGKDALQLYVSSLEKANLSQNEMTFFMEAIASDATMLLPLLRDNGQAMTELGDEAKRLGLIMEKETIDKLKTASIEINKFKTIATILTGEIVTKVVPAFSLFWQGLGTTSDAVAMLTSKFLSFLGFLSRSVSATLEPIVKQFESLKMGIEGVMLGLKREFGAADKAFKKSADLQKESWEALKDIPSQLAEEAKRANREMEMDSKAFEESTNKRREKAKKAWSDMWGENVDVTEKSMDKIDKATGGGKAGATTATTGKTGVSLVPVSTDAATPERRRKFGESLTRYDPTTGEERKFGESFSRSDSVNRQQRLKDVMAQLEAKNKSGQKKESAESATIKSAEHLEVIKDELTRKGN